LACGVAQSLRVWSPPAPPWDPNETDAGQLLQNRMTLSPPTSRAPRPRWRNCRS